MASTYERYRDTLREAHVAALSGRHHAEALSAYRDAAGQIEGRAAPHVGIGRMELALGSPFAALAAFETALAADPGNHEARIGHARAISALTPPTAGRRTWPPAAVPCDSPEVHGLVRRWETALAADDATGLLDVALGLGRADRPGRGRRGPARRHRHRADRPAGLPASPAGSSVGLAVPLRRRALAGCCARYLEIVDDPDELERPWPARSPVTTSRACSMSRTVIAARDALGRRSTRPTPPSSSPRSTSRSTWPSPGSTSGWACAHGPSSDLDQLARYLEVDDDVAGRTRLAAFVNDDLWRTHAQRGAELTPTIPPMARWVGPPGIGAPR